MKRPSLILTAAVAVLALAACRKPAAPQESAAAQARSVRVLRVAPMAIQGSLAASGDLVPREEAAVLPEVSGYRVARVLHDVGDYVRQGQPLVQMDPALIEAQVAQAQGQAAQAEAQALQAEDQAKRVQGLDNEGVLSAEAITERRLAARSARATATAAQATLKDARIRRAKLMVPAPVSGLILERTVRPGDLSATGTTPWFRMARGGEVELLAQLSEDDLARVRIGQHAMVTVPSGTTAAGVVRLISPQVDPQTKLGTVRITLPVRSDIRSGGFGRAVFADASGQALAVPETAIRYDADGASVMVVGNDNRVKRVPITAGSRGSGLVQLIKGPPAGTRVVAAAAGLLLDGDLIRPVEAAAPQKAAGK